MNRSPLEIARALHAALEAGRSGGDLRPLFTDDASTLEHPNAIKPAGAVADLAAMTKASVAGASLLSSQRYEIRDAFEHGSMAVVRLKWTGVIARDLGKLHAGQTLVAHIAQFIEARDGRISKIETYDCYEPF